MTQSGTKPKDILASFGSDEIGALRGWECSRLLGDATETSRRGFR